MESFTVRQYARDMGIPEGTAWNTIIRGTRKGLFVKTDKIKANGRFYQRYTFAGEEKQEFTLPKPNFFSDPFNRTGWRA